MKLIISSLLLAFALTANALPIIPTQNNVTAKSFLVTDIDGEVILEKNADQQRPIASITKLMTVMVVLDANQDLDEIVPINFKMRGKYHTRLPYEVRQLPRRTLIELALVKSDNLAAYTLCEAYPGGVGRCVAEMNHKAVLLHLTNTHYADPTGLDPENISTARDLAQLVLVARHYRTVTEASGMPSVDLKVKRRWWHFGNTNPLVKKSNDVRVSKTGYIGASGGCVVMLLDTNLGQRVIVLLGSKNTRTRFPEAERIAVTVSNSDVSVD